MKEIQGIHVLETLAEVADPKHTTLLLIDIQNDNSSPKGSLAMHGKDISWIRNALPRVQAVLARARQLGLMIIFTRMTRTRDGSHESGTLLRRRQGSLHTAGVPEYEMEGTWGHEVLDELEPRPNERQVIKYRPSSFIGTSLELILKSRSIKSAVVVGLVTEGCVGSTVNDLQQYGYYPVVLRDCVCSSRPDLHDAAMQIMSAKCDVVNSEELLKVWRS
ncbi:MAG: cysteine hydrolase [Chloroflexi bacterium]|nr:cysteine hydrolase [Chloroflexota bacterium]